VVLGLAEIEQEFRCERQAAGLAGATRKGIYRGRLTVWFDEQAIAAWRHTAPAAGSGAPRVYADLAIECALVFKAVYHRVTRRHRTPSKGKEAVMLH
jgi:DNA invertase Pin-like site-specific DNA recombinase